MPQLRLSGGQQVSEWIYAVRGADDHLYEGSKRWPSAGEALRAAFALFPDFSVNVTCDVDLDPTQRVWFNITRPQFRRLADQLGPHLETVDQVADFVRGATTVEDNLAEFREWEASQGG